MDESRRSFLKKTGGVVIGVGCGLPAACTSPPDLGAEPNAAALAGKRWAMVIDTVKCKQKEGCRACTEVCHKTHNVPQIGNPEEEIKWIWKEPYANAFPDQTHPHLEESIRMRPVPVLCNHCDAPPCAKVCPTQATWRRPDGVVMMDMHRCVGCRYCIAGCPYGSRSFNFQDPRPFIEQTNDKFPTRSVGVVEKCNFCAERLAVGEPPACVTACERSGARAIVFGDLEDGNSPVAKLLRQRHTIRRKPGLGTAPQIYYIV